MVPNSVPAANQAFVPSLPVQNYISQLVNQQFAAHAARVNAAAPVPAYLTQAAAQLMGQQAPGPAQVAPVPPLPAAAPPAQPPAPLPASGPAAGAASWNVLEGQQPGIGGQNASGMGNAGHSLLTWGGLDTSQFDGFLSRPDATCQGGPIITCPALCLPPGQSVPRPGRVATQYAFTAKFSPDPTAEYMYTVINSGTSRHILNTDAFYLACKESHVSFTGIGGHREYAKKHCIWAGLCTDDTGKYYHLCSYGTYVPTAGASLLSVGQLIHHGNSIVHEGLPNTGKHGMYLRNRACDRQFIPFEWDEESNLWWVKFRKLPTAYSLRATAAGALQHQHNP
eukprot:1013962-Rhodomonas_salina.1